MVSKVTLMTEKINKQVPFKEMPKDSVSTIKKVDSWFLFPVLQLFGTAITVVRVITKIEVFIKVEINMLLQVVMKTRCN